MTETRTALLDSAERAARRSGFDGFSYADLAADVGIRKASIHHHFPTKAALSVALIQRYIAQMRDACADIDKSHDTGGGRLFALIDRYRLAMDGGKSLCLCVSFSTSRDSLSPEVIAAIRDYRIMMIGWSATVFARGRADGSIAHVGDPMAEAAATLPLLEGAQLAARAEENPARFETAVQMLMARLR